MITTSDPQVEVQLGRFGHDIGMAFQIIDDILDYTGNETTIGKPIASDLRQGLVTLPAILFIQSHPNHPDVLTLLNGKCLDNEKRINRLVGDIQNSNAIHDARAHACTFIETALKSLENFPSNREKMALIDLANYIVSRDM
jgi:geranylgeranyl pyrophosphate synthase